MTKRTRKPALRPQTPVDQEAGPVTKTPRPDSKLAAIAEKLRQPDGVTINEIQQVTGWQPHSIRGALAGALKKKFGLTIVSEKLERGRVYRATSPDAQP